jgi:hypothetical protein
VEPLVQWKSNECYTTLVCVFVALGIQLAMRMRHIAICDLPHAKIFFHINKGHNFRKIIIEHKMCFEFLYNFCLRYFFLLSEELSEI